MRFGADFYFTQSDKDDNWAPKDSNVRSEAFKKMPNKSPYYMDDNGNRSSQYFLIRQRIGKVNLRQVTIVPLILIR